MARKPRDYKAEYQRRKQLKQLKSGREGATSRGRSVPQKKRPALTREQKNRKRRLQYWLKKNDDIPAEDVKQMLRRHREEDVIEQLKIRFKAADEYEEGKPQYGQQRWKRQNKYWPVSLYWYHGGFG